MKKLFVCFLLAHVLYGAFTLLRPVEEVISYHTVEAGDTMYSICNDAYICENNAEPFNQFWYENTKNNPEILKIGSTVKIVNRLYK